MNLFPTRLHLTRSFLRDMSAYTVLRTARGSPNYIAWGAQATLLGLGVVTCLFSALHPTDLNSMILCSLIRARRRTQR